MSAAYDDPAVSRNSVNTVIRGAFQDVSILEFMATSTTTQDYAKALNASTAQLVLIEGIFEFWRRHRTKPAALPLASIVMGLVDDLKAFSADDHRAILAEARDIVQTYVSVPMTPEDIDPPRAIIRFVYAKVYTAPRLQEILVSGIDSGNVDTVTRELTELRVSAKTGKIPVDPFHKNRTKEANLLSSGISWFDELIGGSLVRGDSYGLLAHSGCGKTTLAGQLTMALAAQGRKVLIILTEQTFSESKLVDRFWAVATGKECGLFEEYASPDLFPDTLVSPVERAAVAKMSSNIRAFDLRQITSMQDVEEVVAEHKPDIFIIDWAGTLAKAMMAQKGNSFDGDRNQCLREIADLTNLISKRHDCTGLVFHQLAEHTGKNPFKLLSHHDAAECKTFHWNLSGMIVFCAKDKRNNLRMVMTKGRWGEVSPTDITSGKIVHLNGKFSRFDVLSGYRPGRGMWARENEPAEGGDFPPPPAPAVENKGGYT